MAGEAPLTRTAWKSSGAILAQLAGFLGAPLLWLAHFQLRYSLVTPACRGGSSLMLHLASLVTLLLMAGLALLAWRSYRIGSGPLDGAAPPSRSRFLGLIGLGSCLLFGLVVLAQWIPAFLQHPCYE